MQKNVLIAGLFLLLGCTRHNNTPLTPSELLLTSAPWKLQQSDSFFLGNDGLTVTSTNSFHAADCGLQPHYIFNTDHTVRGFLQCDPPADTVITLTKDSLVIHQHIVQGYPFANPLTTILPGHAVFLIERYTH